MTNFTKCRVDVNPRSSQEVMRADGRYSAMLTDECVNKHRTASVSAGSRLLLVDRQTHDKQNSGYMVVTRIALNMLILKCSWFHNYYLNKFNLLYSGIPADPPAGQKLHHQIYHLRSAKLYIFENFFTCIYVTKKNMRSEFHLKDT